MLARELSIMLLYECYSGKNLLIVQVFKNNVCNAIILTSVYELQKEHTALLTLEEVQ